MFCPKCGVEYREGFTECADCCLSLVAEKPPEPVNLGVPDLDLVTVLETSDPVAIAAAKGLLEEAGIPYCVLGDEFGKRFAPLGDFLHPWCRLQVGSDREVEARQILEPLDLQHNIRDIY